MVALRPLLLAALPALAACGNSSAPAVAVPVSAAPVAQLAPLKVQDGVLRDSLGRQVILRGLNHIGLRSNRTRPAYRVDDVVTPAAELFDLQDLEDADFAFIASLGFSFLRPVFTWEFAQPDPPPAPYNEAYFALIDDFLDRAAAHGLYVLFDFGQFGWGRAAGGNAGAPAWTLSDTCLSLPGPTGNAPPQASARVGCAFMEFWQNEMVAGVGLQDAYIDLWREVMRRYRDHPAVVMVDLFNEPYGALIPPIVLERQFMYPFYRRLAAAIREIDPEIVVGFQPELYHSLGIPTPAPEAIGIDNAIFLPHNYTAAYFVQRVDPSYPPGQETVTRADLTLTAEDARTLGTPFLIGETGWTRTTGADGVDGPAPSSDPSAPPQFGESLTRLANELHIGWAWFAYSSTDEPYGVIYGGEPDEPLLRSIATPFPRAVGGTIESITFDPGTARFELRTSGADTAAEISVPLLHYPQGVCITVDEAPVGRIHANGVVESFGRALHFDPQRALLELPQTPRSVVLTPLGGSCGP